MSADPTGGTKLPGRGGRAAMAAAHHRDFAD